jgi:polar amino acid transport system substrate-binding protein
MKKILIMIMLLTVMLFSKEVKVVFSYSTPPYVFKDGSGIVLSIVKEALAHKGHTIEPIFANMGRASELFRDGYVDATSITQTTSGLEAFYSDDFMQYHNAAFILKKRHIKIEKLEDLKDFHIIAFQNAHLYLGEDFGRVARLADKKYMEVADQKQQVLMFLNGRTDVAVMDRHIFTFYKNLLIQENKVDKNIEIELIELFSPTPYKTAFKDEKLRDDFNAGMKHLKETGRYDEIYNEYSKKYFEVKK